MIRAIFFDLDDTLIRYEAAHEIALAASHAVLASRHPHICRGDLRRAIYAAYEKHFGYGTPGFADLGILSVKELRETLTGDALRTLQIEPEPDFIAALIETHEAIERREIRLFADTLGTLDILAKSFPLGVITNGPSAMQRGKLARLELTRRFPVIIVDSEFGHPKPDTRIFAHAAESVGFAPEELLFVGNSPEADVAGAVSAGWTCVWLNANGAPLPPDIPAPHYVVQQLSEIVTIQPVARMLQRD
ncbi:MAG: HAD family hydrolase [Akkermansiaceae bacterium]|nr:HAD family hydrolase [Armatimonadota bacterium]